MEIKPFKMSKISLHFSDGSNNYQMVANKEKQLVCLYKQAVGDNWVEINSHYLKSASPTFFATENMKPFYEGEGMINVVMAAIIIEGKE